MLICPQCQTKYPGPKGGRCDRDGILLVDARTFAESDADPLVGTLVAGRYRVEERLGSGGMGRVYRATQLGLRRTVALKVLKKEHKWDRDTVIRFHREARAMSLLLHPNTVRVFDFGATREGLLFLAMEYLDGEILNHKLERRGALEVTEAIRIAIQVLNSLHEAHNKGIIHRDLKPDNVFLADIEGHTGVVAKVLDFGVAKILQGGREFDQFETQAGTVFGTPRYMSPEQAQGKPLDPRTDLYSVGILLYQLLTGEPPFNDDEAVVVMARHIQDRPIRPSKLAPEQDIPHDLDRAVIKALAKDPDKRFQTAEEFALRLEACLADLDAPEPPQRFMDFVTELPRIPLAIGSALVAGAFVFAAYLVASPARAGQSYDRAQAILLTDPPGADVIYHGKKLGRTPLTLALPEGTELDIEVRKTGFPLTRGRLTADGIARRLRLSDNPEALADSEIPWRIAKTTSRRRGTDL